MYNHIIPPENSSILYQKSQSFLQPVYPRYPVLTSGGGTMNPIVWWQVAAWPASLSFILILPHSHPLILPQSSSYPSSCWFLAPQQAPIHTDVRNHTMYFPVFFSPVQIPPTTCCPMFPEIPSLNASWSPESSRVTPIPLLPPEVPQILPTSAPKEHDPLFMLFIIYL